jgi:hypothetical protein
MQSGDPLVDDIEKALAEMGVAKENADEAKAELNRLIAEKLYDGADPFVAMMDAMLYVIPQLMTYKEEKLVEATASFEYINSLNAYMAETQKNFSASADRGAAQDGSNTYGTYQYGSTSFTDPATGRVHGLNAGRAYEANLMTLESQDLFAGLPGDVQDVMNGSIDETLGLETLTPDSRDWDTFDTAAKEKYNLSETLWGGINAPKWRMWGGNEHQYDNNLYDTAGDQPNFNYFVDGQSQASYLTGELTIVVDQAVTQNAVMQSTLNGYSKKVESEFKFEMENYNTIVSLNTLMYQDQINLNNTHITRLRAR